MKNYFRRFITQEKLFSLLEKDVRGSLCGEGFVNC